MGSHAHLWPVTALLSWVQLADTAEVRVIDTQTHVPVKDIITLVQDESGKTGAAGLISIPTSAVGARATVNVRAPGYARVKLMLGDPLPTVKIPLRRIKFQTVYPSIQGVSNRSLRDAAAVLQGQTAISVLVIDTEGDRGGTPYPSTARMTVDIVPE